MSWFAGLIVYIVALDGLFWLLNKKKQHRDKKRAEKRARRFCAFWCYRKHFDNRWQVDRLHAPDLSQRDILSWAEVEQVVENIRTCCSVCFVPSQAEKDFKVCSDVKIGVEGMAVTNGFPYKVKRFKLANYSANVVVYSRSILDLDGPLELNQKRCLGDDDKD